MIKPFEFYFDFASPYSLKRRTDNAYKKGIFGAPSFIINNKIFWGQDRLEFVLSEALK